MRASWKYCHPLHSKGMCDLEQLYKGELSRVPSVSNKFQITIPSLMMKDSGPSRSGSHCMTLLSSSPKQGDLLAKSSLMSLLFL